MPDCHFGKGSTVGSVIPTAGGIIPAAVGVDIGCGMIAVETIYSASQLPDNLDAIETGIEQRIPLGAGARIAGSLPARGSDCTLDDKAKGVDYRVYSQWQAAWNAGQREPFCEVCLDEAQRVWLVLHSGSRSGRSLQTVTSRLRRS
jgi:tRNA-splicing ligase RtcB